MIMLRQRIGKLLSYLEEQIYPRSQEITGIRMVKSQQPFEEITRLSASDWEELPKGTMWGGHREYYWFDVPVVIPEDFHSCCVCFELLTGKEGGWDATNPQFACYVDGRLRQGLDVNHREFLLTECASAGEEHHIFLAAFTGDQNFQLKFQASIKVLDRLTQQYYYDVSVPYQTACLLDPEDEDSLEIIQVLNQSLNRLDFRQEGSPEYQKSLKEAEDYLQKEFYEKRCRIEGKPLVCCVGHTHIDCAWLWTLQVTRDKAVRSFSTVLELMRRYPEYRFMSSQPLLYQFVKEEAPEIYEEIRKRIAEGRWEVEGSMYVEPDCNLSSGESLVRQILYGKRFFKEEFGKDNVVVWLPDVFGYSAALPQIMKRAGIRYFMTTKINWNEFNRMPYDTFLWRGIDGTEILTHFMPVRDYKTIPDDKRTDFFTTYNGLLAPSQVMGSRKRYSQKYLNQRTLMACGYGDGGGGTTDWMLENQRRMAKGIPGCPVTVFTGVRKFFEQLEQEVSGHPYLPRWCGELYLEYHRGTYTTMGRNKRYNRKAEFAYQNLEWMGMLGKCLLKTPYPKDCLKEGWQTILKNQFHDILPGSSIKEVYEDSKKEYEGILEAAGEAEKERRRHLTAEIQGHAGDVIVWNPNQRAEGLAEFILSEDMDEIFCLWDGKKPIPVQKTSCGTYLFQTSEIPSKGYRRFERYKGGQAELTSDLSITSSRMENQFFCLELDENGQFARIYDKKNDRELLPAGAKGNVIMSYEDRPHNYDAWDINHYYAEKCWEVNQIQSIKVVEQGPVRAVLRIERSYLSSTIAQNIILYQNIPRIDIQNEIDWKEHLILLKCLFPVDMRCEEAVFEIQYGSVKRPTHSNTSWDFARFEVCAHKWLDVSEWDYGVSFFNDCKYGVSVRDNVVGLTMLKSPLYPNPEADKEFHQFTYSIYPHQGSWQESGTVRQAYLLNNPFMAEVKERDGGWLPAVYSLVQAEAENIVLEVVKQAEDSEDMVLRLYECWGRRTKTKLSWSFPVKEVWECDLLEQKEAGIAAEGDGISMMFQPFEIKTVKLILQ